jgi:hypothetical protein
MVLIFLTITLDRPSHCHRAEFQGCNLGKGKERLKVKGKGKMKSIEK